MWNYEKRLEFPVNIKRTDPAMAQLIITQYGGPDGELGAYYVDHTAGVWPQAASGVPFSAATFQSVGDPITDLSENLAAEQKARTTYDNLLRIIDDPDVREPLKFLRAREIVHFQRFGEALRIVQDHLDSKNFYAINPAFDCKKF